MGNYISIGSKFRPFSYAEMLAPVHASTEAHLSAENQYNEVSSVVDSLQGNLNPEKEAGAYSIVSNYNNSLKNQAAELMKNGLTQNTRRNLMNIRSQYNKEVVPVTVAYQNREAERKLQLEGKIKDGSIVYDRDAATTSLDAYLNNPSPKMSSLSINEVYSTAAQQFSDLAKKAIKPATRGLAFNGQYLSEKVRTGYTPEEINAVIQGSPNADKELTAIYNNVLNNYMTRGNWGDIEKGKIKDAVNRSMSFAIGTQDTKYMQNRAYDITPKEGAGKKTTEEKAGEISGHLKTNRNILVSPTATGEEGKKRRDDILRQLSVGNPSKKSFRVNYPTKQFLKGDHIQMREQLAILNNLKYFNNNGKMLTKYEFITQLEGTILPKYNTEKEKREVLTKIYNNLDKEFKLAGIKSPSEYLKEGKVYKRDQLEKVIKDSEKSASGIQVHKIGLEDPQKIITNNLYALTDSDNNFTGEVIKSYDSEGNFETDPTKLKIEDLFTTNSNGERRFINDATVVSPSNSKMNGVIVVTTTKDNKNVQIFVPYEKFGEQGMNMLAAKQNWEKQEGVLSNFPNLYRETYNIPNITDEELYSNKDFINKMYDQVETVRDSYDNWNRKTVAPLQTAKNTAVNINKVPK